MDEINSSSMSDIAFLLLIFFMVASVFYVKEGIMSSLPKKDSAERQVIRENVFFVTINGEQVQFKNSEVGTKEYSTIQEFREGIQELDLPPLNVTGTDAKFALLTSEGNTTVQNMVEVLGIVKDRGFRNISLQRP